MGKDLDTIDAYMRHFTRLVQMEREEEMRRHQDEIERMSGPERERVGRAVLGMRGRDSGIGLGGRYLVKFVKRGPKGTSVPLPDLDMGVGDLVLISKGRPRDDDPTGTVIERTGRSLTVAFDKRPPQFVYKAGRDGNRVDLYVNDITYQRMLEAITSLGEHKEWCELLLGHWKGAVSAVSRVYPKNKDLNDSQVRAVAAALGQMKVHLVHGPPGTGKTVTCIEVIEQFIDGGKKVLATADSNVATDNMLEMLIARGRKALRVGHPARVTPTLRERTLDHIIQGHPLYMRSLSIREEAFRLKEVQDRYTLPSGRWRRGLSNEEILRLASKGKGTRGIPADKVESMAEWIRKREELDHMFAEADRLQREAVDDIIGNAEVVCTTNSTAGSDMLKGLRFNIAVIDEATQALEPAVLIPLLRTDQAVLAGDHKQLPPTILNRDAEVGGLSVTVFERLLAIYGDAIKSLLEVQYRMHHTMMDLPNKEFYDGRLKAHASVEHHTLAELDGYDGSKAKALHYLKDVVDPSVPMVLIDVGKGDAEATPKGSTSKRNMAEARVVKEVVTALQKAGLRPREMAVISPYDAQVDLLRSMLWGEEERPELEIGTVDGFQGREKEAVVLSLVRSNGKGDLGFLTDLRRLNVSITRARRKLVIVTDVRTISVHKTYRSLVELVERKGRSTSL